MVVDSVREGVEIESEGWERKGMRRSVREGLIAFETSMRAKQHERVDTEKTRKGEILSFSLSSFSLSLPCRHCNHCFYCNRSCGSTVVYEVVRSVTIGLCDISGKVKKNEAQQKGDGNVHPFVPTLEHTSC